MPQVSTPGAHPNNPYNNPGTPGHAPSDSWNRNQPELLNAQRVDTDPNMASAWQNESSVRHVGSDGGALGGPNLPYVGGRNSSESHGSPNRGSMRPERRAMAV